MAEGVRGLGSALAENVGVDHTQVEGSGVGGRITVTDVRIAAQKG